MSSSAPAPARASVPPSPKIGPRSSRVASALATTLASALLLAPLVAAADEGRPEEDLYARAFAQAAALDRAQRFAEAARALEAIAPFYPQDFALALELAFTHYRAGDWPSAEQHYRRAQGLAPSNPEARLGLALSLEKQNRRAEARGHLHALMSGLGPEASVFPEAQRALLRCQEPPSFRVGLGLSFTSQLTPDHPYKSLGLGGAAQASLTHASGVTLAGTYRYGNFTPPASAGVSAWSQNEGYVALAYSQPFFGLGLQYGVVADGSGVLGTSHHLGLSGRISPFGDIVLGLSASVYPDMNVLRAEPSWKIPLPLGFSVKPALGLQLAGGEPLVSVMATVAWDSPRLGFFFGGKYGDELRPAYLDLPLVYDLQERIKYGLWTGGSVNVGAGLRIHLTYAMDRQEKLVPWTAPGLAATSLGSESLAASPYSTFAHALTLGTSVSF
jgi:tetratricopeptide (TPR) repeat protein